MKKKYIALSDLYRIIDEMIEQEKPEKESIEIISILSNLKFIVSTNWDNKIVEL